jgi:hypothetical protein
MRNEEKEARREIERSTIFGEVLEQLDRDASGAGFGSFERNELPLYFLVNASRAVLAADAGSLG